MAVRKAEEMKRAQFLTSLIFLFYSLPAFSTPWWQDSVLYEIFVRSFQDSNNDGIGDLKGISQRLDYLKSEKSNSLGVTSIWLSPIFPSPSYHGYDVMDYRKINPDFGDLKDFQELVRQSHLRGIKLILDLPINHSSSQHPWFIASQDGENTPYRDWYLWRKERPPWGKWFFLESFFYYSYFDRAMPQLNWKNLDFIHEIKSILDFWISEGVDGFRLDAARYYIPGDHGESDTEETHQAIQNIVQTTKNKHPETFFVGEVWADSKTIASYFPGPQELDSAFSFPLSYGLIDSLLENSPYRFFQSLITNKNEMPSVFYNSPFLTNHDVERIGSRLNGNKNKLALAGSCLMALPGTPVLYFGEEIGMQDGVGASHSGDLAHRLPMQWNLKEGFGFTEPEIEPWQPFLGQSETISVEAQENGESLLNEYRRLIGIRNSSLPLRRGDIEAIEENTKLGTISWKRVLGDSTVIFLANFSRKRVPEIIFYLSKNREEKSSVTLSAKKLFGPEKVRVFFAPKKNRIQINDLPPFSSVFIDLKQHDSNL